MPSQDVLTLILGACGAPYIDDETKSLERQKQRSLILRVTNGVMRRKHGLTTGSGGGSSVSKVERFEVLGLKMEEGAMARER